MPKNLSLNPEFILAVSDANILVFEQRGPNGDFIPPKAVSLRKAQEQVFIAVLNGFSCYGEDHGNHVRIYIVSKEEMARAKKEWMK